MKHYSTYQSQFIEMFGSSNKIKLGELATFVNGSAFKPEEWGESGLPIVRIQNLTGSGEGYNRYNGDITKKVIIEHGDILISWSATLGVYIWTGERALLNQHIFRADIDKDKVDKDFFIYTVQAALNIMGENAHGSTMKHVVKKDFDDTLVAYPSFAEQRRFSTIYKQADKSKFTSLKSQFIEMFQGEFPTEKWEDCLSITNGKKYDGDYQESGSYPICGSGGIMGYGEQILCPKNTVILGRKGNINSPIFMESDYWIVDTAFCLDVDGQKLQPKYFYYWCKLFDFTRYNKQGVLPSLTKNDLLRIDMPIPPMNLQNKFVDILNQADKSKYMN